MEAVVCRPGFSFHCNYCYLYNKDLIYCDDHITVCNQVDIYFCKSDDAFTALLITVMRFMYCAMLAKNGLPLVDNCCWQWN